MDNSSIARILSEMADLHEIGGENVFKIRALRNGAAAIEALPFEIQTLRETPEKMREIKGIGGGIAKKIVEICSTGSCGEHRELLEKYPSSLLEILEVEGVGPKKVRLFHDALGVRSVPELEAAAREGKIRELPRMSAALEKKLLKAIESHKSRVGRFLLPWAEAAIGRLAEMLKAVPGVRRIEPAGSFRRGRETVGDLDILVSCKEPEPVMDRFCKAGEVVQRGETKCSIKIDRGFQVDLRIVPEESFGAALHYFTGSKAHNVAIRTLGVRKGLTINEYGVYRAGKDGAPGDRIGGEREEDVFSALGLSWIPPELRENRGEIEAATGAGLPGLIEERDLLGDVHMHTTATDGTASIQEMALAAAALGRRYVAITDHSKALAMTGGLNEDQLRIQIDRIAAANIELRGKIRILSGIEVDILRDGELDLSHQVLRELDVVVGSVHSHFNLPGEEMTARVVKAIESGCMDIFGHPSGRILLRRDPYSLDMQKVFQAAREHGVAMELSAYPDRLDLTDVHCRMAKEMGVQVVISTDAHTTTHLQLLRFGVTAARRGWLEPGDVLNTRDADEFLSLLHEGHR